MRRMVDPEFDYGDEEEDEEEESESEEDEQEEPSPNNNGNNNAAQAINEASNEDVQNSSRERALEAEEEE